jgi:hypothetical protein
MMIENIFHRVPIEQTRASHAASWRVVVDAHVVSESVYHFTQRDVQPLMLLFEINNMSYTDINNWIWVQIGVWRNSADIF